MELERVKAKSLRAQIYEQLRDKIMLGEIKPGEELSLRKIAEQLGVSLMPVREAIWQLESDNILVVRNNRGIKVNTLSADEMTETLRLRSLLEAEAATLSCERRQTDEVLPVLSQLLYQMEEEGCTTREFLELNRKFHFTLYSCAESPLLLDLLEKLWARITPYIFLHITAKEDLSISPARIFHRQMFEYFKNRDVDNLVKILYEDIKDPASSIIQEMKTKESS